MASQANFHISILTAIFAAGQGRLNLKRQITLYRKFGPKNRFPHFLSFYCFSGVQH